MEKGNLRALAPIGVFLVLYLGLGILFEYVLKIEMGFYSIPIVVIFLVALLVACFQNRKLSFDDKLAIMGRGIGDKTIVTMILIFMAADTREARKPTAMATTTISKVRASIWPPTWNR